MAFSYRGYDVRYNNIKAVHNGLQAKIQAKGDVEVLLQEKSQEENKKVFIIATVGDGKDCIPIQDDKGHCSYNGDSMTFYGYDSQAYNGYDIADIQGHKIFDVCIYSFNDSSDNEDGKNRRLT